MVLITLNQISLYDPAFGGEFVHTDNMAGDLEIKWEAGSFLYSVSLVDTITGLIHLLIVNIQGGNLLTKNKDTVIDYIQPAPPFGDAPHRYIVNIYKQDNRINKNLTEENWNKIIENEEIKLVDSGYFNVGSTVFTAGSSRLEPSYSPSETSYFKAGTSLPEDKQKWCRCVIHVATKQNKKCLEDKAWFQTRDNKQCYNPYSICSKSVGTSSRECGKEYAFTNFSDDELKAYAYLHKELDAPKPYNRSHMLNNIATWKAAK